MCASCAPSSTSSRATGTFAFERARAGAGPGRLGILGGTFNPPHRGHLALAAHARAQLALDQVLLVPAHTAPFKSRRASREDPGPEHRLRMCELAAADAPGVHVCAIEIERGGVSYTVDTLRALHARDPSAELTLILGADVARTLASWREAARVLELAHVAVARRPGAVLAPPAPVAAATVGAVAGEGTPERCTLLQMQPIELSSSMIRRRVACGEPVAELVGQPVADYIAEHGLYRTLARAGR